MGITINQSGKPAGVAGIAREDLDTGVDVALAVTGGPFLAYQWSITGLPVDVIAGTRSAASLSSTSTASVTIAPIDQPGTYAGRLVVDSGSGLGASEADVFEWSFYAGISGDPLYGEPADGDELPAREPAFVERLAHNTPDAIDPSGNRDGWKRTLDHWFAVVRRLYRRQWFALGIVTNDGTAALGRQIGIGSVSRTSTGVVEVTLDGTYPDADYMAVALPIGAVGGSAIVTTRSTTVCTVERGDPGGSLVDADFVLLVGLRF